MNRRRVYISGPMSGIKQKNKPLFDNVEYYLKSIGYDVINPAAKPNEILDRNATEEEYLEFMKEDILQILYNKGGAKRF